MANLLTTRRASPGREVRENGSHATCSDFALTSTMGESAQDVTSSTVVTNCPDSCHIMWGNDGIDRVRTSRHRVTNDQLAGNEMAPNRLLLSSFIHHTMGAGILPLTTFTLLTFLTINQMIQISVCLYLTVNHTITT